jgi:molybdate transport system ATP-binding protein
MSVDIDIRKRLGSFTLDAKLSTGGGTTALLGASGCGKTLLLKCVAGIVRPDAGRIVLNGSTLFDSERGIDIPPQRRRVGYLFQNYALFPTMTVAQNIACGLHAERDRSRKKRAVAAIVAKMGIQGLERRRPHQLSGGQQQRAALARILVGDPELLLLDEPLSALDSHLRDRVLEELRQILADFDREALLVTHSRDEAYRLSDALAIMDDGGIVGAGPTRDVFQNPGTRAGALLTGCKNIAAARKIGDTRVDIPEWGVALDAGRPVGDALSGVGVRAHAFGPGIARNARAVRIAGRSEEPFEWTVRFRYEGQRDDSAPIWWRVPKGGGADLAPEVLGVSPEDVLLLYD